MDINNVVLFLSRHLGVNELTYMDRTSLDALQQLRSLRLEGNRLRVVPTEALASLRALEVL